MDTVNPQKIKLLKLYEMLRQHTDEDRPLSTNQLCAMLKAEGITVTDRDQLVPAAGDAIRDGSHIAVNYARPVDLTVDGASSTHWVTATDVDGALTQIGRRYAEADISVSRSSVTRSFSLNSRTPMGPTLAKDRARAITRSPLVGSTSTAATSLAGTGPWNSTCSM